KSICIGEEHSDKGGFVREMLIEHMEELKDAGVEWIGIEASWANQEDVDKGDVTLVNLLKGKKPPLGTLTEAARRTDVPVFCYDYEGHGASKGNDDTALLCDILRSEYGVEGDDSELQKKFSKTEYRFGLMNRYAAPKIDEKGGRYLVLVGNL